MGAADLCFFTVSNIVSFDNGDIQRMMTKNVAAAVVLNEKQSCLIFPDVDGKLDAGYAFTSEDPSFHQWCFDYFNYSDIR